jgi:hypothetical protein
MNHFHAFYENEGYGGDIIDVNRPCPDPDCTRPDRYVPADHNDDFTASDVLAAFIRSPHTEAALDSPDGTVYYLDLAGTLVLNPEQAAALSPLFAEQRGGTLQP